MLWVRSLSASRSVARWRRPEYVPRWGPQPATSTIERSRVTNAGIGVAHDSCGIGQSLAHPWDTSRPLLRPSPIGGYAPPRQFKPVRGQPARAWRTENDQPMAIRIRKPWPRPRRPQVMVGIKCRLGRPHARKKIFLRSNHRPHPGAAGSCSLGSSLPGGIRQRRASLGNQSSITEAAGPRCPRAQTVAW
jgi:hypothetical protein